MQLLATEQLGTGISRDIGVAPGAGGTDHCFGIPVPALGMDTQRTAEALDGGDPYWPLNREISIPAASELSPCGVVSIACGCSSAIVSAPLASPKPAPQSAIFSIPQPICFHSLQVNDDVLL